MRKYIKIFKNNDIKMLEDDVNNFIINPNIKVININYDNNCSECSCMVYYKFKNQQ